ncbi:hypothetical protein B296_00018628 [Ensete ventricosum]|uniref:Uncharacterized protein n=1 Tax=Ensete ventricosum TaxID=4639 RepID=A0A426YUN8_ENSVE|nr:hypothetical protein B296_00018628 [Ensete ventricosum]
MVGANGERVGPSVRCPFVVCDAFLVREAFHAMALSFFLCHVMSSRLDQENLTHIKIFTMTEASDQMCMRRYCDGYKWSYRLSKYKSWTLAPAQGLDLS